MAEIDELKNKFQKGTAIESRNAIIELLKLTGIDEDYASSFTNANYRFLSPELNSYGFTLDNAFVVFISRVYKNRKQIIDYLLIPENWSIIHNAVAKKVITVNQLKGSENEVDAPKLLFNPSFYKDIEQVDKMWVLQLWNWCANKEGPEKTIRNEAVRLYLKGVELDIESLWKEYSKTQPELSFQQFILNYINKNSSLNGSLYVIERIRRAFLFTDDIIEVANQFKKILEEINSSEDIVRNENLVNNYNYLVNKLSANISFISEKLVPSRTMSASVRACGENVIVSNRDDINGKFQKPEGSSNKEDDMQSNQSSIETNNIQSKAEAQDILKRNNVDISKLTFSRSAQRNAQQVGNAIDYMLKNRGI